MFTLKITSKNGFVEQILLGNKVSLHPKIRQRKIQ
jgi:hypothetical protein